MNSVPIPDKTFCEFFAGIGLVREGLTGSGWSCLYANDLDPKKRQLYEGRFGAEGHFHLGDVWNTDDVLGRITGRPFLATASFPCVDLSLAGRGRGFEGSHSSTFFGFVRLLEALGDRRPKAVLLENVSGFVTSAGGKDFETAARALADLGYWLDAFMLDAGWFLPQSRPRVFVVGVRDDLDRPTAARRSPSGWIADAWTRRIEAADHRVRPPKLVDRMKSIDLATGWTAFDVPPPRGKPPTVAELIDLDDDPSWWDEAAVSKHHDMMNDRHRARIDAMIASGETFVGTIFRRKRDGAPAPRSGSTGWPAACGLLAAAAASRSWWPSIGACCGCAGCRPASTPGSKGRPNSRWPPTPSRTCSGSATPSACRSSVGSTRTSCHRSSTSP